jgi:PAS domain S-box-containing protein
MSLTDDDFTLGLANAVPDALVITDRAGRIVFVNASCEAMFGYTRAELVSQPVELLVPQPRRAAHVAAHDAFSRAPVTRPMGKGQVLTGRRKDGAEIPVEVSLGTMDTKSGVLFIAVVRDVTERVQAEETLRRSEQRYRELFESAPDGIFMATPDGRYTDVNAAGCRLLGYTREELIGKSITELVAPEVLARQAALARHLGEGGSDVSEWELRRKDGTFVPVELSSNTLPDGRLRGFTRDISERRRLTEAILRSEERLARAQHVAHVGSFDWDVRTNGTYRSTELCALFGLGPEAEGVAPWTLSEMIHPDDREAVLAALHDARSEGRSYRIEHRIVRRDGAERVVLHQGEAVMEEGRVARIVGTMLDITERKRVEAEREESLQELQAVLDRCPVGIVLAHGAHGEEVRLNLRARALAGRPIDHVGQYPALFLTPDGGPIAPDDLPVPRALRGEHFDATELLVQRADGSRLPVSASGAPVPGGSGAVPRAVVVFQDISATKELERLRSEWSSIVAHDLRQPLNAIMLHARIVTRAKGSHPAAAVEAADAIVRAAARLNRMIEDLLDLSRLEARRLTLSRRPTDLPALVRSVALTLGASENAHPIDVRVGGSIPLVDVDPDRIAQVLENLVSNATKYGAPERPIVIEIGATPGSVHVAVTNEGTGIAPDELPRLFSRFVRTEDAARGRVKGIGLGLYITRELVAAHGGEITAESVPGERTTFRFTIPIPAS